MRGAVITSHCELCVVEGCLIDAVNQNYFQSRNPGNLVVFISNKEREKKSIHPGLVVMKCGLGAIQYSCLVLLISLPICMQRVKVVKTVKRQATEKIGQERSVSTLCRHSANPWQVFWLVTNLKAVATLMTTHV